MILKKKNKEENNKIRKLTRKLFLLKFKIYRKLNWGKKKKQAKLSTL